MGPGPVIQLAVPVGLEPVLEHPVQPVLGETPLDAVYAGLGHIQGQGHLGSGPALAGFEQDVGPCRHSHRTTSSPNQVLQLVSFLRSESYREPLPNHNPTSQLHDPAPAYHLNG